MNDLEFTDADRVSATWLKIERYLNERLDSHRRQNDAFTLNQDKTNRIRGRIAEIKNLLEATAPAKPEESPQFDPMAARRPTESLEVY